MGKRKLIEVSLPLEQINRQAVAVENPRGFPEVKVPTVCENSPTLGFDESSFEDVEL